MDTKRLIIAMVIMTALIMGWEMFTRWMYERNPQWRRPGQPDPAQVAEQVTTTQPDVPPPAPQGAATPATQLGTAPTLTAATGQLRAASVGQEQVIYLGSDERSPDGPYRMQLALTTVGAGVQQVVLNEFDAAEEPDGDQPRAHYTYQKAFAEQLARTRVLATESVTINGQVVNLAGANWAVTEQTEDGQRVVFAVDVLAGETPVARVYKTYQLSQRQQESLGYQLDVVQRVQNLSAEPITIRTHLNGPVPPVREMLSMDDRQVIAGYDDEQTVRVRSHMLAAFEDENASLDLTKDKNDNRFLWFGASSVYFNAIVRPKDPAQIANVTAVALNPQSDRDSRENRKVTIDFATAEQSVAAGAAADLELEVFLGPKKREVLGSPYFYAYPRYFYGTLGTLNSGCANWCTADWLINGLVWLLGIFHFIFRDWGVAIICLVVIVRLCLHPLTKKSTVSMSKMQKMAPEMERLKKKYGDNKEELNRAMMQLYKEQGAGPLLGCLPMFLQMPIWIALWSALQNTFELRQAGFLHWDSFALTWIDDLSKPDRLLSWEPITLFFGFRLSSLNILPILLAVVFFLQQKMTPKPPAMTPEQQQQQKMMQWMTLLFPLFLYNGPSGLNLYILTSTTIGIIEMKRIRAHIKEQEELEKINGPVVIDAGPTRQSRKLAKNRQPEEKPKKGLAKWLADLQAKAEEMQRQQQQQKRKKQ